MNNRSPDRRLPGTGKPDLLDLLASGHPPAFATNQHDRIVFWNRGAEALLGRKAEEVLQKPGFEVLQGRDVFGNRFCYENCPFVSMTKVGEPVHSCELNVTSSGGQEKTVHVTALVIPGSRKDVFTLVHILQPVEEQSRVRLTLEKLSAHRVDALPAPVPFPAPPATPKEPPLTNREREILYWIAAGLQNKEVAKQLHISHATVRNHIRNILEKLEVHSKLEALSLAFRNHWVTDNGAVTGIPDTRAVS